MFHISSLVRTNNILTNSVQILQRGYVSSVKIIKQLDDKLIPPRRPASSFLRFHNDMYTTFSPEMKTKAAECSKLIGQKWRELSDSEKQPYEEAAEKSKREYELKYEQYLKSLTPNDYAKLAHVRKRARASGKNFPKIKDPNAPKRSTTAYIYFLKERYPFYKDGDRNDAFKKIAAEWRQVSTSDRKAYEERAAADRLRYDEEIKDYLQ
ncbi:hypothetical protein K7432_004427 [Basidiobolus ranarum]|uniref:HMG box domain-containing protein n=1 Tax=Basidiobolus ranarum TaxID=34480 RepID=A0ABR2W5J1_9FUNG